MPAQMERTQNGDDFCDRLRHLRGRRVWTLQDLSEKSGVHYTTISRIETKREYKPHATTIRKLAKALGVSAEYLRFGTIEDAPGGSARMHLVAYPVLESLLHALSECCAFA